MEQEKPNKITTVSIRNRTKWKLIELKEKLGGKDVNYDVLINLLLDNLEGKEDENEEE